MQNILTHKTVSMTELRDPAKVIAYAGTSPVAILNRNHVVGYFVPADTINPQDFQYADSDEVQAVANVSIQQNHAVLEYLRNK